MFGFIDNMTPTQCLMAGIACLAAAALLSVWLWFFLKGGNVKK